MPTMRRYRRAPRRQGVVYGSPRAAHTGGEGSFVGRLLGPIVIVIAFGLLAAGAWAFMGRGGPSSTGPSPTGGAVASPTLSATPSLSPTPTALATATPIATLPPSPSPSPSPTEFAIEVREGPGSIQFGTSFNQNTLRINDPRTTFPPSGRLFWSAQLTEAPGVPSLLITVSRYDPATGSETLVREETWEVQNERATIFLRRQRVPQLIDGPGIYVVRYLREDILLAEGYFRIE